jgi:hypothetical protein
MPRLFPGLALTLLLVISSVPALAGPGADLLSAAEDYAAMVDYAKASSYADKAIGLLGPEIRNGEEKPATLARAHYLKAYVLTAQQAGEKEILEALKLAVAAAPGMDPPKEYASHPTVAKLLPEARKAAGPDPCEAQQKARGLFEQNDFCGAWEAICNFEGQCKDNAQLEEIIIKVSRNNCPGADKPGSCPPLASSAAMPTGGALPPVQAKGGLVVFPLIFDLPTGTKAPAVTTADLTRALKADMPGTNIVELPGSYVRTWSQRFDLGEDFRTFVIKKGQVVADVSFAEVLEGTAKKDDLAFNKIPQKLSEALAQVFRDYKAREVLFAKVTLPTSQYADIELRINRYNASNPEKPDLIAAWRNVKRPQDVKETLKQIPHRLKEGELR